MRSGTLASAHRVVGVIHLPPLPGSARGGSTTRFAEVLDSARVDAVAYAEGGADAIIVENFGDAPFARGAVEPHVIAAMTMALTAAKAASGLPVGVNVLRNDVLGAVAIAAIAGGTFVRANVYAGVAVTDQGVIEGEAEAVQALIRRLEAPIAVWADIDVKHSAPLAARPLADLAQDAVERGLATATIVSGRATGHQVDVDDLVEVRSGAPDTALYVGSGATAQNAGMLLRHADGLIVGTAAKLGGLVGNRVDVARVRTLVSAAQAASPASGGSGLLST